MSIMKNSIKDYINQVYGCKSTDDGLKLSVEKRETDTEKNETEWIWVKGYKGTNVYMCCRDYQFELDKQYDMPDGAEIEVCRSGFHFCTELKSVYNYYPIENDNRFFEVEALVDKKEYEKATCKVDLYSPILSFGFFSDRDKLAAKSIKFVRELSTDEVLNAWNKTICSTWNKKQKEQARSRGVEDVRKQIAEAKEKRENKKKVDQLVSCGYTEILATYMVENGYFNKAYALGSQSGISMDVKIFSIFNEYSDED